MPNIREFQTHKFNSMAPGARDCNFKWIILNYILATDILNTSCEMSIRDMD